jgi:hypothetical protein
MKRLNCFYLTMAFTLAMGTAVKAQTPGGTALTTEIWISADRVQASLPAHNTRITLWNDRSPYGRNFNSAANGAYFNRTTALMNYQPALTFASGNRYAHGGLNLSTTRAYYICFVSRTTGTGTQGTVFTPFIGRAINAGWYYSSSVTLPYLGSNPNTTISRMTYTPSPPRNYGVVGAYMPNFASPSVREVIYFNGDSTGRAGKSLGAALTAQSYLGTSAASATNPFIGDLQELIVLTAPNGYSEAVNHLEVMKVNSYLALKYGITLRGHHYYSPSGAVIWDRTANASYASGIAGIGHFESGGFHQKQATSYDDPTLTVFVGDNIAELNQLNPTTIPDNTYLILGHNELNGYTAYTFSGQPVNKRQNRIYKARTNFDPATQKVKIKTTMPRADFVMVSSSATFPAGTTAFYPIKDGIASDVAVTDDSYIGFAFYDPTPGGITTTLTTEFWLAADKLSGTLPADGASVSEWKDLSPNLRDFAKYSTNLTPKFRKSTMNFQPAVDFYYLLAEGNAEANQTRKLVSKTAFTVNTARAYYTFWVSEPDATVASYASAAVLSLGASTAANSNNVGWYNNNNIWTIRHTTRETGYGFAPATGMPQYGIGAAIVPNSGAQYQYHNGVASTNANLATARIMAATTTQPVLSNGNLANLYYFYGKVQEVIVMSAASNAVILPNDLAKVHSYLAIKYGQTLGTGNYVSSEGSTKIVWDRGIAGSYTKGIFGLARDDASGLYQKQATSYDKKTVTVYLRGSQLKESNRENTETMPDKTYVMFSSNDRDGWTPYEQVANTGFLEGTNTERLNQRLQRALKVQSTTDTTVNMQLHVKGDYVLVSNNESFPPANTRIYKVTDRVATVEVKNGEYIGFAFYAPTPGATNSSVYSTELWLASDRLGGVIPTSGSRMVQWNDNSPWERHFVKHTALTPQLNYEGLNYHPGIDFRPAGGTSTANAGYKMVSQTPFPLDNTKAYYTFWVSSSFNKSRSAAASAVFSFGSATPVNSVGWTGGSGAAVGQTRHTTGGTSYSFAVVPVTSATNPFPLYGIGAAIVPNNTSTTVPLAQYFNGLRRNPLLTAATRMYTTADYTATVAVLGNTTTAAVNPFYGKIEEVIVLARPGNMAINDTVLWKVNSYLAIKYGISLDSTANGQPDYRRSDDTVVWKGSSHVGYRNAIFGIGRDDATGLYQKQGKSAVANNGPTVFVGPALTTLNTQNTGTLKDKSYLVIGSNGRSDLIEIDIAPDSVYRDRNDVPTQIGDSLNIASGAVYMAQLTDTASIQVGFLTPMSDFRYVFVSKSDQFLPDETKFYSFANINSRRIATGVVIDTAYRYITFVGYEAGPGGVNQGLRLWLRADDEFAVAIYPVIDGASGSRVTNYPDVIEDPNNVPTVAGWTDLVRGHKYTYEAGSPSDEHLRPVYQKSNLMTNYHPAIRFWSAGDNFNERGAYLSSTASIIPAGLPAEHSAFFLANNAMNRNSFFYTMMFGGATGTGYDAPGYGAQLVGTTIGGRLRTNTGAADPNAVVGKKNLFTVGATTIMGFLQQSTNVSFRFNGVQEDTVMINRGSFNMSRGSQIGKGYTYDRTVMGVMSEVIIYNRKLGAADLVKLESYMGIKYGITLRPPSVYNRFDYTFSDGTTVFWKGNVDESDINYGKFARFYNHVAAVIRDDDARLDNRQAHSTDAGSIVHMGVAGKSLSFDGSSDELGEQLNNGEAIVWGSTSLETDLGAETPIDEPECGEFSFRFNRKWLVHKVTDNNRPIAMLIGAQDNSDNNLGSLIDDYYNHLSSRYDLFLIVASTPAELETGPYMSIPMHYVNGEHQCNYTFTEEDTYFTFGYKENNNTCAGTVAFTGTKTFQWTQWVRTTNRRASSTAGPFTVAVNTPYDMGDSIMVDSTKVSFDNVIRSVRYYPQVVNSPWRGGLEIRRTRGAINAPVTATVDFHELVIPSFSISDVDASSRSLERIEVIGQCPTAAYVAPTLTYAAAPNTSNFTISGNVATVDPGKRNLTGTNKNGMFNVTFNTGVTRVIIRYTITGNAPGTTTFQLYLSPITVRPVPPAPPINEFGLSFVKQVKKDSISTCEPVEYTFHIGNSNCDSLYVNFADTLPEKMVWKDLILDPANSDNEHISINGYAGTRELRLDSLLVSGDTITRIDATAVMLEDAPTGTYDNRADIKYTILSEGTPVRDTLVSLDYATLNPYTSFHAKWDQRQDAVLLEPTTDRTVYVAEDEVELTYTITNPNVDPFEGMYFTVDFNPEFKFMKDSFWVTGTTAVRVPPDDPVFPDTEPDPTFTVAEEYDFSDEENPYIKGFTLPAGGTVVIRFKLKAPAQAYLVEDLDDDGVPITGKYMPLTVNYSLVSETADPCAIEALPDPGELLIPYAPLQANDDAVTVQAFRTIEIDVLANDRLSPSVFLPLFNLLDSVTLQPRGGTLDVTGSGHNARLVYTSLGTDSLASRIDSFHYEFTFYDPALPGVKTSRASVYIYVLEDRNGASVCRNTSGNEIQLMETPDGVNFYWFTTEGGEIGDGATKSLPPMMADSSWLIRPDVPEDTSPWNLAGGFPEGLFTVHVSSAATSLMRWTGAVNHDWRNPNNWVEVVGTGASAYERPVTWPPSSCTEVTILAGMQHYPELTVPVNAGLVRLQSRALLKNPHVLKYDSAKVELQLNSLERDRFVMWSAPLMNMYSGDYHFKDALNAPVWGDVYMNLFQQANPDPFIGDLNTAKGNMLSATFGEPGKPLPLGTAFNLKVTSTTESRDRLWIFPQPDNSYPTGALIRTNRNRFITDGKTLAGDGTFDLPVAGGNDLGGHNLVQIVNPYLAYLNVSKFLTGNSDRLATSGYLIWGGDLSDGFTAVRVLDTVRYFISSPTLTLTPAYIPPLQSFFAVKNPPATLSAVKMSPDWTTTAPDGASGSYQLRAAEAERGLLRIGAVQGGSTSHAVLQFDRAARTEYNANEDVRALFYEAHPLALYLLTPEGDPLAISAAGEFESRETDLGLRLLESGEVTLTFSGMELFGHNVYLLDREAGLEVNLQQTPSYTFLAPAPSGGAEALTLNSRFALRMEYTGVGNRQPASTPKLTAVALNGELHIRATEGTIRELHIYSISGTLIYRTEMEGALYRVPVERGAVYIVKAKIGETTETVKVAVK